MYKSWVHRSIAVARFIFCKINDERCVLANQRDEGAPDEDILENGFSRQVTFYEKD